MFISECVAFIRNHIVISRLNLQHRSPQTTPPCQQVRLQITGYGTLYIKTCMRCASPPHKLHAKYVTKNVCHHLVSSLRQSLLGEYQIFIKPVQAKSTGTASTYVIWVHAKPCMIMLGLIFLGNYMKQK